MKRLVIILLCCLPTLMWAQSAILNSLNRMHTVQKGETIYSISKTYGISMEALENANRDVVNHKIKKGMKLVIPAPPTEPMPTVTVVAEETQVRTHYEHLNVAVLLPFEEQSERAAKFVEFYQGLLMAADSVRSQGAQLDIYAWHCGTSAQEMQLLLTTADLEKMDVVFGPADGAQIPLVAQYCQEKNIRLVLPFSNSFHTQGYPLIYSATASHATVAQDAATLMLDANANRNFVFLMSNQPDARGAAFTESLRKLLNEKGITPRVLNIEGDDTAIANAFDPTKENCVIPDNTSIRVLNILISKMNAFKATNPDYRVSLQGFPEWQAYTANLLPDMFANDTYVYSTYYKNPLAPRTAAFESAFAKNFGRGMIVSIPQYGMMGFDLGYYFLHGLATLGDTFELRLGELQLLPYQHPFHFERRSADAGFINRTIQLIHYTPNQTLEIITPK